MKRWLILLFALLLAACASTGTPISTSIPTEQPRKADYPDQGAAPELVGDSWVNTATALRMADLRGKVVLVDMWTFG